MIKATRTMGIKQETLPSMTLAEGVVATIGELFVHTYFGTRMAFINKVIERFKHLAHEVDYNAINPNKDEVTLVFSDCKVKALATWRNSTPKDTDKLDEDGKPIQLTFTGQVLDKFKLVGVTPI